MSMGLSSKTSFMSEIYELRERVRVLERVVKKLLKRRVVDDEVEKMLEINTEEEEDGTICKNI